MVKEGLHPEIVVHPQGLELLGKGKVREDHIVDLNHGKSVFNQLRPDLLRLPVVQMGSPPGSLRSRPSNGIQSTGRLEGVAVGHGHVGIREVDSLLSVC